MSWPFSLRWIVRYKPFDSSMSRILARRLTAFTRQPTIFFFNAGGLGETFLGQLLQKSFRVLPETALTSSRRIVSTSGSSGIVLELLSPLVGERLGERGM